MKSLSIAAVVLLGAAATLIWMHSKEDSAPGASDTRPVDSAPLAGPIVHQPDLANSQPQSASKEVAHAVRTQPSVNASSPRDEGDGFPEVNPDDPTLEIRLNEMSARRNGQIFDPDEVMEALREPAAWETAQAPGEKLSLSEEEMKDGREFIRFNRLKLETLVKGDTLELPVDETGEVYKAKITRAETNSDGSVTWQGTLIDQAGPVIGEDGNPYLVTFTSGDRVVSGGIFTPKGHFVIQAVEEQGWLATSQTLYKQDKNEPCVLVPGQDETDHHQP